MFATGVALASAWGGGKTLWRLMFATRLVQATIYANELVKGTTVNCVVITFAVIASIGVEDVVVRASQVGRLRGVGVVRVVVWAAVVGASQAGELRGIGVVRVVVGASQE
jgi:hypothetical protein